MPANDLKNGTWVLVADGEKALFLVNEGDAEYPVLRVRREESQENLPTREQGTDRPGRTFESTGTSRSAYEETDWQQLAEDRFADHLAEMLYKRAHRGEFQRIVIVAAPKVLGRAARQAAPGGYRAGRGRGAQDPDQPPAARDRKAAQGRARLGLTGHRRRLHIDRGG